LDIDIQISLLLKGDKATLVMDIKVTLLIEEERATLVILDIKAIFIL